VGGSARDHAVFGKYSQLLRGNNHETEGGASALGQEHRRSTRGRRLLRTMDRQESRREDAGAAHVFVAVVMEGWHAVLQQGCLAGARGASSRTQYWNR
jgi:hypothetical protein